MIALDATNTLIKPQLENQSSEFCVCCLQLLNHVAIKIAFMEVSESVQTSFVNVSDLVFVSLKTASSDRALINFASDCAQASVHSCLRSLCGRLCRPKTAAETLC